MQTASAPLTRFQQTTATLHSADEVVGGLNRSVIEMSMTNANNSIDEGAALGATAGLSVTAPVDFFIGDGDPLSSHLDYDLKSEGVLGVVAHGVIDVGSTVAQGPGGALGIVAGIVTSPLAPLFGTSPTRWVGAATAGGAYLASEAVAEAGSVVATTALTGARLASGGVKMVGTGVGAVIGAVGGFLARAGRAILGVPTRQD